MTFGDIDIDLDRYELRRAGAVVAVEPKVFDLIAYLASNANRLVSKDELIEKIWLGRIVSDAALSSAIKSARRALGEGDLADSCIKTVRGRGFRMELPDVPPAEAAANMANAPAEAHAAFVMPSFVVVEPRDLPEGFVGITLQRRISAAMARVPFLTVAAPAALRHLEDQSPARLAEAIGPGFALDIAGLPDGGLDCILFNTASGATTWTFESGTFSGDRPMEDAVAEIVAGVEPQIVRAIHEAASAQPGPPDPRLLTMQAFSVLSMKGWNRTAFAEAEATLRQAIEIDPGLAFARAALALVMALGERLGLVQPDENRRSEAIKHADTALDLDGMTPAILGLAGCALVDAGQGLRGRAVLERGMSVDPMNSQVLASLGAAKVTEREFEEGADLLDKAIRLSPRDGRLAVWCSVRANALMMLGRNDEALVEAKRAVAADDKTHLSRVVLAAVHMMREDAGSAAEAMKDARRVTPDLDSAALSAVVGKDMAGHLMALPG